LGTGGTISGTAKYLKEQAAKVGRDVQIVCPDPVGSIYKDEFYTGNSGTPGIYRVEGIGHDFMVGTLDMTVIDEIFNVSDHDSFRTARHLAREEGIFSGGSTGTAVFGALQVAKRLGPDKIIVVIICDSGDRYLSKCYNDDWMRNMGFLGHTPQFGTVSDLLKFRNRGVEFADPNESLTQVVERMSQLGISQMPVHDGNELKMIHEQDLLHELVTGGCAPTDKVSSAAKSLRGRVTSEDTLAKVQTVFDDNNVAVVVDNDTVTALITKIDMIEYLAEAS
jgi:cystathionine beta-synthase